MIRIIHFLFILLLTGSFCRVLAQENHPDSVKTHLKNKQERTFNNEIGINLFNIIKYREYHPTILYGGFSYQSDKPYYLYKFLNGISYKYHYNKYAFRTFFTYNNYKYRFDNKNTQVDWYSEWADYYGGEIHIGFEKTFGISKLKPYLALDVLFVYDNISYGANDWRQERWNQYIKTSSIGISPIIGLNYLFHKRLSISIEISAYLLAFKSNVYIEIPNRNGTKFFINPISLFSLNFHF